MKQIKLIFLIMFLNLSIYAQTGSITGIISDKGTNETLQNANILIQNTSYQTTSGIDGSFIIQNLEAGDYTLLISNAGYADVYMSATITSGESKDLGVVYMVSSVSTQDVDPVAVVTEDDLIEGQSSENISGMLHGSSDVFLSTAGYTLGPLRFRVRGYDAEYTEVTINSIPMENLESDFVSWSNWGGLNNVTKNQETTLGLTDCGTSFGNVGGTSNLIFRASKYNKGTNLTYSLLNKAYRNRLMATYSTGMGDNGWAFTFSGSRRWAQEGYTEGTFYDAWSYFVAVEKKFNDHHSINFVGLGAPNRRGKEAASTQEVYDLLDNVYYNPNWGYQGGEKRNSKISNYHQPILMLTHYWDINETTKLETSASYKFGRGGQTALDWYNARDPRPDYYRNLPSYMTCTEEELDFITEQFINNSDYHQINWDDMYQVNYNSNTIIENVNGIEGNDVSGNLSQYILEERRNDENYLALNSNFTKEFSDYFTLTAGVQVLDYRIHNYKKMFDLLGGEFFIDNDKYAERDLLTSTNEEVVYNDIRYPNRLVYEGDIFGYDYVSNTQKAKVWAQTEFSTTYVDMFVAAFGSYTSIWRTGNMQNGKFPNNSLGNSEKQNFTDYGVKGGLTYKITGRHYIYANGAYLTNAPNFRNVYESPRTRDQVVEGITSEKIMSFDGGYALRAPRIKASLNFFYTEFQNQTEVRSFYLDLYRNFINYVIKDMDKTFQGIEFGVEANVTSTLTASGILSLGYYRYSNRPTVDIFVDNSAVALVNDQTIFIKDYKIAGTPQTAASMELTYNAPKYWYFGITGNYVADRYLDINMDRRTADAVENVAYHSDNYYDIINQEELPGGYTIDMNIGKSLKFGDYTLYLNFSLNNILDNDFVKKYIPYETLITGGYEQSRLDVVNYSIEKFPPKYYYNYGTSYYLNVSLRF